ncbi:MAG: UbiD family decarboxylase [Bacteroidia bacterium]
MAYKTLRECVTDLERNQHLIRIKEEVDPDLEMAAIHLRVHEAKGPAIFFENLKGCQFPAVSNLFGTIERSKFIFRDTLTDVKKIIQLKNNPQQILRNPALALKALKALPKKYFFKPSFFTEISIDQLPQIKCWQNDGGAFITLPQVYTEDIENPGVMNSNLGMYRIQLSGNDYVPNKEIGLHYQLNRGIGVHQSKSNVAGKPLKVSIFIGGPPAHTLAAVMPLPENMSELTFAGILANRRFRYAYKNNFLLSCDADFVITGEVFPNENKPEGPFGDHLGYYSLKHNFPVMRVEKVYHRKNAIYPFTVVGRPPQEDTAFGALIHELTGNILPKEISGLHEINAVDAAGVHPLLLAIGSERYTPYIAQRKPQEILTIANHILGFGQMSLAKYLFICAKEDNPKLSSKNIPDYFQHILERVDFTRDLHFHTRTTIDTLDYSGSDLNSGSKLIIAAAGDKKRTLGTSLEKIIFQNDFRHPKLVIPGIIAVEADKFESEEKTEKQISLLNAELFQNFPLIILCDNSDFVSQTLNNFLWVTFTRSNPSHDVYGMDSFVEHKHWGCKGSLIIDARIKPHHSPILEKNPEIEKRVDKLGEKGNSLHGII